MSPIAWRRRIAASIVVALALALAAATRADAAIVTARDLQGRTITYDVHATAVDTNWYTAVLRASAHGDEISSVTIQIVPEPDIEWMCGGAAAACYTGGRGGTPRIIIPAGKSANLANTLLHEYGHHLDTAWRVAGVPELNGTPGWWNARGMATLLSQRRVAFDYSLGWEYSVGEIFAEDYAAIHTGGSRYAITWLRTPDEALKVAMFAELGSPQAALPESPEVPLVINRSGTLVPRDRYSVPFGLLGPGRHVTLTATLSKPTRKGIRARAQIVCDGRVVSSQPFGKGRAKRVLDIPNLGPASCDARLISNTGVKLTYRLTLRLAVEKV